VLLGFQDSGQHFNNSRINRTTNSKDRRGLRYRSRLTKGKANLRPVVLGKHLVSKFKLQLSAKDSDMLWANKNRLAQASAAIWALDRDRWTFSQNQQTVLGWR
jgi:hypothetical protein